MESLLVGSEEKNTKKQSSKVVKVSQLLSNSNPEEENKMV